MPIALIILLVVLIAMMTRSLWPRTLPIWLFMLLGAIAALALQQISLVHAYHAINWEVMFYLFGVFILAEAIDSSGYLTETD